MIKLHVRDLIILLLTVAVTLLLVNDYTATRRVNELEKHYFNHQHQSVPNLDELFRRQGLQDRSREGAGNRA
jgi:hypothetical protein